MEAGEPHGIVNAGYRAIESLRLEKGYRAWGSDIGPDHTPLEAGLAGRSSSSQGLPFLGRDALAGAAVAAVEEAAGLLHGRRSRRRVARARDDLSRRPARRMADQRRVGLHRGKNIGFGYVRNADGVDDAMLTSGSYELEVAAERVACRLHLGALYDPRAERVKA